MFARFYLLTKRYHWTTITELKLQTQIHIHVYFVHCVFLFLLVSFLFCFILANVSEKLKHYQFGPVRSGPVWSDLICTWHRTTCSGLPIGIEYLLATTKRKYRMDKKILENLLTPKYEEIARLKEKVWKKNYYYC